MLRTRAGIVRYRPYLGVRTVPDCVEDGKGWGHFPDSAWPTAVFNSILSPTAKTLKSGNYLLHPIFLASSSLFTSPFPSILYPDIEAIHSRIFNPWLLSILHFDHHILISTSTSPPSWLVVPHPHLSAHLFFLTSTKEYVPGTSPSNES